LGEVIANDSSMSAEFVEKSDVAEYSTDEVEAMDAAEGTATTLGLVGD
jgi:hypothetical protein